MLPASFTADFIRQLELRKLSSRRAYLGTRQGGHRSLKRGHGLEFSDYRKYEQGDNPRSIDWGVYARSDRLYVKRFQEEQELTVLIILDTSLSTATPASDNKWERACEIAIALGYITLMNRDRLLVTAPGYFSSPAYDGARAVHSLTADLSKIKLTQNVNIISGVRESLARVRHPGVVIFISDFLFPLEDVKSITNQMRSKNLDIVMVRLLGDSEINPFANMSNVLAVDSETGEELPLVLDDDIRSQYSTLLEDHTIKLQHYLLSHGARFIATDTSESLSKCVIEKLGSAGLIQ